ncbi:MAG: pantetheine-phosphate adenylyltransferase [Sphaerochaetaceae bacterium]|nr:pantetheine-phosphate adenylyltransferase [Sphaerochaetaceae bacterium]MDD3163495.1 pantetheine-phosphate adenylyltransferase [Sphaerochaetaceae bacterium]MDD4007820.1 pantetheine-phosphate adenylyltransferase [Sphaerochaetaceae bacterium]MDD4397317.1 pantetheine-phosphate adenylyltransferase [Sphaerochaetaceae bacterium]
MNGKTAMLPGTFDPPTNGHINIIERSASLYDKVYIVVADNIYKKCLFSVEERVSMLESLLSQYKNITVASYQGLVVEFAKKNGIDVIIRGVRALADFSYEFELAMTNKQLYPEIETLFIPTDPNYFILRSSAIKELALYKADISKMVPPAVAALLEEKYSKLS